MPAKKRQFTGLLRKAIDLSEAPARGLRAALAAPPDASDLLAYAREQLAARWAAPLIILVRAGTTQTR